MELDEFITRVVVMNLLRYFVVAGMAFLVFYVIFRRKWLYKKIQNSFPRGGDYAREIIYSMITIVAFVLVAWVVYRTPFNQFVLRYEDISEYGWGYWALSIFLMILLHDTYFYWMHRFMHHPAVFKVVHLIHHKSTNPSPWAAYAFHPIEAIIEASIIFPIALLIPFHTTALLTFLLFMIIYNVYGHLGWELYPKGFNKHWLGKWLNTSVNHNQHHKHFEGNYGLYFLFWDRWLGTIREDYDESYEEMDEKRAGKTSKTF